MAGVNSPLSRRSGPWLAYVEPIALLNAAVEQTTVALTLGVAYTNQATSSTLTAPSPTLIAAAKDSTGWQAAYLTAPRPTLTITTGANSKLTAPKPALATTGTVSILAEVSLTPPIPVLSSTGTVTGMATANLKYGWDYGASNYGLESYGGGNASAKPLSPTLSAIGKVGRVARSALTAPRPKLASAAGAYTALTAPTPTLSADALRGSNASFALAAPTSRLTVHTGVQVELAPPVPALSAKALRGGNVVAGLIAPSPSLASASGAQLTLASPSPGLTATGYPCGASAQLAAPKPNLVGYGGAVISVTVGAAKLQATGALGGVASVQVTCPLFELTSTASIGNVASASLLAPSPRLGAQAQAWLTAPSARLTAIGSAVVTATYEAYAVNLGHRPRVTNQELPIDEVTHYTNFPFTHIVRYQNSYYGANSTGLYLLEGTTDDGTAIPWAVKTAMDDFKTPVKKTVAAAYFGGRFGPASTVQLHAGEDTPNTYSYATPRDALAQNHRQVFGKGVKERYYALGASGTGVCELDMIELETHNMTRRI